MKCLSTWWTVEKYEKNRFKTAPTIVSCPKHRFKTQSMEIKKPSVSKIDINMNSCTKHSVNTIESNYIT